MKKILVLLLCLCMILPFAACGDDKGSQQSEAAAPAATAEDASKTPAAEDFKASETSETAPAEYAVNCDLHMTVDEWPVIDGALGSVPYYEAAAAYILDMPVEEARMYVMDNNTPAAFTEIGNGTADLIFCLHGSKEQESYAAENGIELVYTPYALDAFVFFVNKDNPVDELTVSQLHDIYAGKITNWKEVGGNDEPIIAYQRNEGSGSQTGLYEYVIPQSEVMAAPTEEVIASMGEIVDAVASYDNAKGAIGYSYLYFVTNQHFEDDIKLLRVNGVEPSTENIQSKVYPMLTEKCLVTTSAHIDGTNPKGEAVKKIIDWCISPDGQRLAANLSYVPAYSVNN